MDEYIEKQKAVDLLIELEKEFQQFKPFNGFEHAMYRELCEAKIAIEKLPAADVVPVVRCKDCKSSCKDGNGRTCEGYWYELSEFAVPVKDDDSCSYGERKENNHEKV